MRMKDRVVIVLLRIAKLVSAAVAEISLGPEPEFDDEICLVDRYALQGK